MSKMKKNSCLCNYNPCATPNQKIKDIDITENGIYTITPDEPYESIERVDINVDIAGGGDRKESLKRTITKNDVYKYTPRAGYVFSEAEITVDVPEKTIDDFNLETVEYNITENGTTQIEVGADYDAIKGGTINVNVPEKEIVLEDKDVVISTEDVIDVVAGEEYDGLSKVQVIPSTKEYNATFTSNNTYNINEGKDLYNGGTITVAVPSDAKEEIELTDTIRENTTKTYTPDEGKVYKNVNITVDVPIKEEQKKTTAITQNGRSVVTPDDGKVLSEVEINVNVPEKTINEFNLETVESYITQNGGRNITPSAGYDAIKRVNIVVDVPEKTIDEFNLETVEYNITQNGTTQIEVSDTYDAIKGGTINVNVPEKQYLSQEKEQNVTSNGTYTIRPDSNYDGLSQVTVNVDVPRNENRGKLVINSSTFPFQYGGGTSYAIPKDVWDEWDCDIECAFDMNVTWSSVFWGCKKLKSFKGAFLSPYNNLKLGTWFYDCSGLTTFNSDFSQIMEINAQFFYKCTALENVTINGVLNLPLTLNDCPLTVDSMLSVMNAMVDLTGQESKTMQFGATNLEKLSDEQKKIATDKNWVLN